MNTFTYITTKFRSNKVFFLLLLVSFLSVQWSTAHIHLAGQHEHDGAQHQHEIKAHAHEQAFSYEAPHGLDDDEKLVELEHDCNRSITAKYDSQFIALSLAFNQLNVSHQTTYNKLSISNHSKRRYLDYSTINLRAPPIYS